MSQSEEHIFYSTGSDRRHTMTHLSRFHGSLSSSDLKTSSQEQDIRPTLLRWKIRSSTQFFDISAIFRTIQAVSSLVSNGRMSNLHKICQVGKY